MDITFIQSSKKPNSTKIETGGTTFNCQLFEPCTIINPVIIIAGEDAHNYNYAYIPKFNRYYFVSNWEWRTGCWYGYLSCDVLASWRTQIGASSQYIARSSVDQNIAIQDPVYVAGGMPIIQTVSRSSPWVGGTYVVGVTGAGGAQFYALNQIELANLLSYIYSDAYAEELVGEWLEVYPELKTQVNPLQYITAATFFPITFSTGGSIPISVGWVQTPVSGDIIPMDTVFTRSMSFDVPKHPQGGKGSYLNLPPYAAYYLRYPPFGHFPLDSDAMASFDSITVEVVVDPRTAEAICRVYGPDDQTIAVVTGRLGTQIQLTQITAPGFGAGQVLQAALQGVAGVAGIISSAASFKTGDAIAGVANLASGAIQTMGNAAASKIPSASSVGSSGGTAAFSGDPQLIAEFTPVVSKDPTAKGSPLCAVRSVAGLGGYMEIYWPHLEIEATSDEILQIYRFMEGGFYYE